MIKTKAAILESQLLSSQAD